MSAAVIYHGDCFDGFTAAWACWRTLGDSAEYMPMGYGTVPNLAQFDGRNVYIVDFSFARPVILELKERARSLLVLDHHKTAEADLAGLDFCVFDMSRSGAGIAWDIVSQTPRPWLIDYVEDRDLWRFALPHSKEVNARIGVEPQAFENWDRLADMSIDRAREEGSGALLQIDAYVRAMVPQAAICVLGGHTVPVVNAPFVSTSELVGELATKNDGLPFAAGFFIRSDGKAQYSLRSRGDFDVSTVAKQFGGGGHRNAAGFTVDSAVHQRIQ
jgi:oligoribonuclease NrnB/cAMP/cGMP phosphodiesterase (DHH superfamily)